jgi:hypothetical protein
MILPLRSIGVHFNLHSMASLHRPDWTADNFWAVLQLELAAPAAEFTSLRAGAPAFVPEVSADTLAQLCAAAQAIQRAWHCRCVRARARNALTGQGSCAAQRHLNKPHTPGGISNASNSQPCEPDNKFVFAAIPVYGDEAGGPVFALRQGLTPAGAPLEPAIYRTFGLLSAAYRGCHKVEFKKFASVAEGEAWIQAL